MNNLQQFSTISAFIFDMDGVLTDGTVLVTPEGEQLRTFSIKDGYILQLAVKLGYAVAVISGSTSTAAEKRFAWLGITDVFMGVKNKSEVLRTYLASKNIPAAHTLFMGDDIPDLSVMQEVGLACCPADAVPEIQAIAHYISPKEGGKGCVRDVMEKVLKLKGDWINDTSVASK